MKVLEEREGGNREDMERRELEGSPEGLLTGGSKKTLDYYQLLM